MDEVPFCLPNHHYPFFVSNFEPDIANSSGGVQFPPPGAQPSEPTGQPAPIFSRDVSGGSSRVDETPVGFSPGDDVFPPGDILDLRVKGSSWESGIVTLVWTAPGDDLDTGAGM